MCMRAGPALGSERSSPTPSRCLKRTDQRGCHIPGLHDPAARAKLLQGHTTRSSGGAKTPSFGPLHGVPNFSRACRPGEPGLTFQASRGHSSAPRYGPQRGQPPATGPSACVALVSTPTTPHARPGHHPSVCSRARGHALVEPWFHLWVGVLLGRLSAPSPSSHPLPEAFPGPAWMGGWISASSGSLNLPTPTPIAAPPLPAVSSSCRAKRGVWVSGHMHEAE